MRRSCAAGALLLSAMLAALPASGAGRAEETLVHVVLPGETLWSISEAPDVYGDPLMWPLIYRFNRDQIQDPSRIYPGQRLRVPMRPAPKDRSSARAEAASDGAAGEAGR